MYHCLRLGWVADSDTDDDSDATAAKTCMGLGFAGWFGGGGGGAAVRIFVFCVFFVEHSSDCRDKYKYLKPLMAKWSTNGQSYCFTSLGVFDWRAYRYFHSLFWFDSADSFLFLGGSVF